MVVGVVAVVMLLVVVARVAVRQRRSAPGERPGYLERGPDCTELRRWRGGGS